jgi:predicted nucleic acid-binding protein
MTVAPSLVLDSSATLPWVFEDESTSYSEAVLDAMPGRIALVPSLYFWEVANVLSGAVRRGRIADSRARAFMAELDSFSFEVASPVRFADCQGVYDAAARHRLTIYDAQYLSLAQEHDLPLATLDRDLLAAMEALGIPHYTP